MQTSRSSNRGGHGSSEALKRLARANGIQTSYFDNTGQKRNIGEESLRLILERLGVDEGGWRVVEPVTVCWQKAQSSIVIRLPAREVRHALLKLRVENGDEERMPLRELSGVRDGKFKGEKIAELKLDIPELPTGYHSLAVESASGLFESLLISAPKKLYVEETRQWGGFIPLYAAHSELSWGAGNFSDWRQLCHWIGDLGGSVMGTLPVMAALLDSPVCEPSPYSPASRLFWNEFFIDIPAVPEFQSSVRAKKLTGTVGFKRRIESFRASELIDYKEEWAVRRSVLEILAREFFLKITPRYEEFREYLRARPEVENYAQFRAKCDATKRSWREWGEKTGSRLTGFSEETKGFYLYAQWIAQEQMNEVVRTCQDRGVKFYLDLPLGVNADGFDAWRYREFFAQGVSTGAPPDSFFTKGQDWGLAPPHPRRARELNYRYLIDFLRFQMRHTGLLRIDHVMGLHRLWWVPHGHPASAGAYVSYPTDELYAILSVESHRNQTTLVGENLGTVPPEVNESMDRHGLRRMYVLQYEQQPEGTLRTPERQVVASVNTHDMPSFAAHWKGIDIEDRFDLGLIPKGEVAVTRSKRRVARKNLIAFLRKRKLIRSARPGSAEVLEGVLRFLARSPAETVLVTLEDLWGEKRSQNVPGTTSERPNWRRKANQTIEQMRKEAKLKRFLREVFATRQDTKEKTFHDRSWKV